MKNPSRTQRKAARKAWRALSNERLALLKQRRKWKRHFREKRWDANAWGVDLPEVLAAPVFEPQKGVKLFIENQEDVPPLRVKQIWERKDRKIHQRVRIIAITRGSDGFNDQWEVWVEDLDTGRCSKHPTSIFHGHGFGFHFSSDC